MTSTEQVDTATPADVFGENAVERAVRSIAGWEHRDFSAVPVTGGLQNENWRVRFTGEDQQFFVKLPGSGTETYIDRRNAHRAGTLAAAAGISPRIVAFDERTGVEVVEFLDGYRACTNGDMKHPATARSVVGLFKTFHGVDPLPVTKTVFDMIDEHRQQAEALSVPLPASTCALLREVAAARRAFESSGLDLVPCHNDPMPGNFLVSERGPMRLIDFEFASNNERAYDLALVLAEFFYDERQVLESIEEFYGTASWSLVARVRVCIALADVKWGLWGCVNQRLNDSWDFDYHKYGVWKLARARAVVADPRWGQWLGAL